MSLLRRFNPGPLAVRTAALSELDTVTSGGPLASLGGAAELKESKRQACLFQYASLGEVFRYLTCRNSDLKDPQRADLCLAADFTVQQCINGPEGQALLWDSAALNRAFDITSSPVVVWENRYGPFTLSEVGTLERLVGESP